jgi:hypothetical protein
MFKLPPLKQVKRVFVADDEQHEQQPKPELKPIRVDGKLYIGSGEDAHSHGEYVEAAQPTS